MSFKEVGGGNTSYPKYGQMEAGELIVEGTYQGTEEGKFGINYIFNGESGRTVLGHAGHLDYLMSTVKEGDLVRVVYAGQEVLKKGAFAGKPAHRFQVLVDDGEDGGF